MAEKQGKNQKIRDSQKMDPTRDPELEIPDPEQVDKDIEEAEKIYRKEDRKSA